MNWGSWSAFWEMGGYAEYIWGSFGVTVLTIALELWFLRARRRAALTTIKRQIVANEDE